MAVLPLFYPAALTLVDLRQYALGLFEPPAVDVIEFPEPEGGVVERELAVPFLAGMDAVVVERAHLGLRSRPRELEVPFEAREVAEPGIVVVLPRVARLLKVGIDYAIPDAYAGQTVRVVVRNAEPQGSSFALSPPVYASPGFDAPGPMFPRPLAGMTMTATSSGAVLTLPRPLGSAWLIQLATGDEAVDLSAMAVTPTVRFVRIDAVPHDLTLAIRLAGESPQLWSHPDLFLPEVGTQEVDFSPLAQKRLSEVLAGAEPEETVTLSVALQFTSASGGDVSVASRALDARYQVEAIDAGGPGLVLGGDWTPLRIEAPAQLRPAHVAADLTVRPRGRELNLGSPDPFPEPPSRGMRIRPTTTVASQSRFLAPDGERLGEFPLVSARAYLSSASPAEVVLELRADIAGAPGAPIAPPVVRQLEAGFAGWIEFDLASPWTPSAPELALWVCLRTNQGEVLWFAAPEEIGGDAPTLVSLDRGASWGAPDRPLEPQRSLLTQMFNAVPDPQPEPAVRLYQGVAPLATNLLRAAGNVPVRQGPREFVLQGVPLPPSLADLLAQRPGTGKVATTLSLFSRAVADLQVTRLLLEYDPFQASAAGGVE